VTASSWAKQNFGAGAIFTGLLYPIAVCVASIVIGGLFIRETKDHRIDADVPGGTEGGGTAALR